MLAFIIKNWFYLACVYRVMDARGKFGEHERSIRTARGDSIHHSVYVVRDTVGEDSIPRKKAG